ncbi:MAG: hypothetical protein H0T51_04545 [Pirellulales bacterium]|nr:hypothetical protein [Pirellulales bacterium]
MMVPTSGGGLPSKVTVPLTGTSARELLLQPAAKIVTLATSVNSPTADAPAGNRKGRRELNMSLAVKRKTEPA